MREYFTGDDWTISITLQINGVATNVSGASDISALVASRNDDQACTLINAVSLDSGATGADWANGVVVMTFPASATNIDRYGTAFIEIQVTTGGLKDTWPRVPIKVAKGLVK